MNNMVFYDAIDQTEISVAKSIQGRMPIICKNQAYSLNNRVVTWLCILSFFKRRNVRLMYTLLAQKESDS